MNERRERLEELRGSFGEALAATRSLPNKRIDLTHVKIRDNYAVLPERAPSGSDRKLPLRPERPPSTRLLTSRGSLLRFSLLALFEAQTRLGPGRKQLSNPRPLVSTGGTSVGWADLLVTDTRDYKPAGTHRRSIDAQAKKQAQLKQTIARLADDSYELLKLRAGAPSNKKFDGFTLLNECGKRAAGPNVAYTVPDLSDPDTFTLPVEFFTKGWVHVLTESEIAMVMMCAHKHSSHPKGFRMPGDDRLQLYAVSPPTFETHVLLSKIGVLTVTPDPKRTAAGKLTPTAALKSGSMKGVLPHFIEFHPDQFEKNAYATVLDALEP